MNFKEIKRPSVVEEIIQNFKEELVSGELKAGDKLPSEVQLMEQMGVGRTALREAMKMLTAMGVIEVRQGDGSYVCESASPATLNPLVFTILLEAGLTPDLFELRALLESGYCQLAAEKASPQDMQQIKNAAKAFEEKARGNGRNIDELTKADLDFHYAIINATHNPLVAIISHAVEELFFSSIRHTVSRIEGQQWGIEGHRRIIAAIGSKNPSQIHQAVIHSLERWREDLDQRKGSQ